MNIDWSKAPEGFPLWLEGIGSYSCLSGWCRRRGEVVEGSGGGHFRACREGQLFMLHEKPEQAAWVVVGLPPVGTVCEVVYPGYTNERFARFIGQTVTVVAHDVVDAAPVAVFRMPLNGLVDEQDYHALVAGCFKPARTPEQIAAEERKAAVTEMYDIFHNDPGLSAHEGLMAIYDAGYRKQVKP